MRVSFGNTFYIYKTSQTEARVNGFVKKINDEKGVEYLGVAQQSRFAFAKPIIETQGNSGNSSTSCGSINEFQKDVLNIKNNSQADTSTRDFCMVNGIKYTEIKTEETPSVGDILTRIENNEDENSLVNIDTERLAIALKKYKNNFGMQKDAYRRYHVDKMDTLFKSGEKVEAPRMSVETNSKGEISIKLSGNHNYTNHNYNHISMFAYPVSSVYFALEEMGAKIIPFSLDFESVRTLKSIGVID